MPWIKPEQGVQEEFVITLKRAEKKSSITQSLHTDFQCDFQPHFHSVLNSMKKRIRLVVMKIKLDDWDKF